eukprot:Hpha_TRINITY_DN15896_c2_g3::TRINITY_DN15896_c2_g3_i3::g.191958::m.191958
MPIQVLSQTFAARVFVIAEATNGREALLQEEMDARSFIPHAHTPRTCAVCAELPMSTPKQSPDQSPVRTEDAHLERKCDAQAQLEPQNERVPLVTPKKSRTESVDPLQVPLPEFEPAPTQESGVVYECAARTPGDEPTHSRDLHHGDHRARPEFPGPCDAPPPLGARRPLPSLAAQEGLLREVEGEQRRTRYVGWLQFLFHRHQLRCLVAHEREVSENKALADSILQAVRQLSASEEQVSALRDVQEEGKLLAEGAPVEGGSSSQVDAAEVQAPGEVAESLAVLARLPSSPSLSEATEPEAEPEALPEPEAKALAPDSQCLAVAVQTPLPPSPPAPDPGWVGHTARRRSPSVDWALEMRLASLLSDEAAGRGALMEDASDAHSHLEQVADLRRAALRAVAAERFAAAQAVAEGRAAVIVAAMEAVSFHAVSVELPPTPPGEVIRWWTGMPIAITAATRMQRLGRALDCRRKVTVLRKHARLAAVYCIQRIARAGRVRSVFQSLLAALSASRDRASKAPLPDSPEEKDPLDLSQRRRASLWMEPRTPVKRGDEMSGGSDGGSPTPSPAGSPRASRWRSARKSSFASLLLRGSRASKRGSRSHPGSPHLVQHDERPIFSQPPTPVSGHVELDDEHSLLLRRSLSGHETRNVPLAKPPVRRSLTASPSARPNLRGAGLSGCSTLIVHVPKMWRLPVGVQGRYKQEGDKPLWTNQRGFRLLQGAGFWLITLSEARGSALLRSLGRIQPGQTPNQVPSWAYPASDSHSTPVAIGPSSSGWRR